MKTNVLGIKSKYFLVIPFVLLLFAHYGSGQVTSDTGEADADKELVACEYGSEKIKILGNADCSNMFCLTSWGAAECSNMFCLMSWGAAECTYEGGEKKKHHLLCSADQNPDGSWTCPGAYACAVDEDHEYHEAIVTGNNVTFNSACEGAGILNMASGELYPFDEVKMTPLTPLEVTPEDTPRTPDPATNSPPTGN